jgi:Flp pilus assembly protein TadG
VQQLVAALRREHGASAVLVAILMVPLLGFAAISLDVGSLYVERGQLQNGADAAALGIAQACSRGAAPCAAYDSGSRVTNVANTNDSRDSLESIASVAFPNGANTSPVTVQTSTLTDSGGALQHPFASIIGISSSTVRATATAAWYAANNGTVTLPLAFSLCGLQAGLAAGSKQLLRSDQNNPSPGCTSADGHPIAGGFGWLPGSTCSTYVQAGSLVGSDPGNDLPTRCQTLISPTDQLIGKTLEVPVFDCAVNTAGTCVSALSQSHGQYHIYGFAAFRIEGHRLTGSDQNSNPAYTGALSCTGNCRGLQGVFVDWSFPGQGGGNPGPDLGAYTVKLTQ